jgi:hypothetical protein
VVPPTSQTKLPRSPSRRQRTSLPAQRTLRLDLKQVNDSDSPELPMPTVLIVDADQMVSFVDTRADYTTRTEVTEIVDALDRLAGI